MTIFFKTGSLGEIEQNKGNLNNLFFSNFHWDLQNFSKFDDFAGKIRSKKANSRESLGVKL